MKFILVLLFIAVGAWAQAVQDTGAVQSKTIAVLEIIIPENSEEPDDDEFSEEPANELTVKETEFLSSELRRQAVTYFPKEKFNVLTKGQVIDRIPEDAEDLTNAVSIGKAIRADYVTYGQVGRLGKLLTLKIELYDVADGTILGEFNDEAPDMNGLVDAIRGRIPALFAYVYKEPAVTVDVKPDSTLVSALQNLQQTVVQQSEQQRKPKVSKWVAIGFDVLAVAAVGFGVYQHMQASRYYDDYKEIKRPSKAELESSGNNPDPEIARTYDKVESAKSARDIAAIAAGVLLASGVTIHIVF
ncbi:MAG: hypothetical protein LBR60_09155 [Fibrobacter sp.]|nr:hypothetical protein [Fibrobacter sp.]